MPFITLIAGDLLLLVGILGYILGGYASWTALIPAFIGVPLSVAGGLALKPAFRKHAMHAAVVIAFLGFVAPLGRLGPALARGADFSNLAFLSQAATALICLIVFVLAIVSFIRARPSSEQVL